MEIYRDVLISILVYFVWYRWMQIESNEIYINIYQFEIAKFKQQ